MTRLHRAPWRSSDRSLAAQKPRASEITASARPVPAQVAADLLNQQIWCWGRDIEYRAGNLLVQHGLDRIEKPAGSNSASIYRRELSPTSRIILRGFGVFCGDDRWGGVYVPRFEFNPRLTAEPDLTCPAWSSKDLPPLFAPTADQMVRCQSLLLALADWVREYEVWIAETIGLAYRRESLASWSAKHASEVPAEEMAVAWRRLGVEIGAHPQHYISCHNN